jgi:alpha-glucuronidase
MTEYDCWFQKQRNLRNIPKERLAFYYTGERGIVLDNAVKEYQGNLERLFGIKTAPSSENGGNHGIVFIGTVSFLNEKFHFCLEPQESEGYIIKVNHERIILAGGNERGVLYGMYRFLFLLATGGLFIGSKISEAPVSPFRIINHWDNLDGSVERGYAGNSLFFKNNKLDYDSPRVRDYARLLVSTGINCISINNVNVKGSAKQLITENSLSELQRLTSLLRPFGINLLLSINFDSPRSLGGLTTADPLDEMVSQWWKERADLIYRYIPDLAGFLVKADSEGESGPFEYNRTHADGANMLARALAPYGGKVFWRCFVYNCQQDWRDQTVDRARAVYDCFKPLDGGFDQNVILQIKHGPYDFQVREPVSPLFGALIKTRHIMELQITQEYTGHQIDLCYLPHIWSEIMDFDTSYGPKSCIKDLVGKTKQNDRALIEGFAGVSNVGLDRNWTGNTLAQANLYGYGRLAWNPSLSAEEIAREWAVLTFDNDRAAKSTIELLLKSYAVYEKYTAPFGICFMVTPGFHYGPSVEGYEFSRWGTYHRADTKAIGIDRTPSGTGYTGQYAPANAERFANTSLCPENLLLFFHRLPYDFKMKNGETLLQNIYDIHFEGYNEVEAMLGVWKTLKDFVDEEAFLSILKCFEKQLVGAREWRDQINTYFWRKTAIDDKKGRKIYR